MKTRYQNINIFYQREKKRPMNIHRAFYLITLTKFISLLLQIVLLPRPSLQRSTMQ